MSEPAARAYEKRQRAAGRPPGVAVELVIEARAASGAFAFVADVVSARVLDPADGKLLYAFRLGGG